MVKDTPHTKTYQSLGLHLTNGNGVEHTADCPFCGHEQKMFINADEGLFDCKKCGTSGNKYTFLQLYYEKTLSETTKRKYATLAYNRSKLPQAAFHSLAYDSNTGKWLVPVRNDKGSMVNLRQWDKDTNILYSTGGCKSHIYNLESSKNSKTVFLCEGEWDAIALNYLLSKAKNKVLKNQFATAIAVPGASTFKKEWSEYFSGKDLVFLYDNDEAGQKGCDRAIGILRENTSCKSIKRIRWPDSYPNKYDVRDFVSQKRSKPDHALDELLNLLEEVPTHARKKLGLVRTKFEEVIEDFKKGIYLSQDMIDGLLLQFAVVFSNQLEGDPLWLFIVGPPGSGKTLLLQSLGDTKETFFQSSLGAKTLVSGFKTGDGRDPSLIPLIIGKTLIVKDYTEIMGMTGGDQEMIYSVLRGAYDGRVERIYGSGETRVYPDPNSGHKTCHFSILAGVTNAIHGDNRAALGERFLKYQMVQDHYNPIEHLKAAINNTINTESPEYLLRESASSFIENKKMDKVPTVPQWVQDQVMGISQVVAVIRAVVSRKQGELVYRPTAEVGTRLAKQLIKLGQCIAFTLDKPEVDTECYRLIKRVALDTCYGWHKDVLLTVARAGTKGITREQLCKKAIVAGTTAHKCLEDLYELGAVVSEDIGNGSGTGRHKKLWRLTDILQELWDMAQIEEPTTEIELPRPATTKRRRKRRVTTKNSN